jgi:hypothetical protein
MTIDLRWLLPVVALYAPGLLMLIGAWALGYTTEEIRGPVGVLGLLTGSLFSVFVVALCLCDDIPPMRVRLWGRGDE